jgi:5-methylcytosine-specific restriction enzyme subunit McrC
LNELITVREFARLTCAPSSSTSLDQARISKEDFDWLCGCSEALGFSGLPLVSIADARTVRLSNYVGLVETPTGTRIEILPKHIGHSEDADTCRAVLRRLIAAAFDLPTRKAPQTSLSVFDAPVTEWIIERCLEEANSLVRRGLRSAYVEVSAEEKFLRGRLAAARQSRQPPERQHLVHIEYDLFVHDRAENRLIKTAVSRALKATRHATNWRLARELHARLQEIPESVSISRDFGLWREDRLSTTYQAIRPWCELILRQQVPFTLPGQWQGISLLFPMERLFERYVGQWLRRRIAAGTRFRAPAADKSLCEHMGKPMFQLRPDVLIESAEECWILDTKWKLVDEADRSAKYGLKEQDFYQLNAYGSKYIGTRRGHLALVYPATARFKAPLAPFAMDQSLELTVLPFDLERDEIVGGHGCLPLVSSQY